ncbi:MAG: uroporphyrinogen decarboxylase [candidate division Zixibacteria bacterium]|nr:uroporphyrinogen decarboxylase [candidate division Zixibacteria bacterium]
MNGSPFIKACRGTNDGRIPIWIMRQAGRYLPEYRAVREKVSFEQLCKSPSLIAEVVRQPVQRFDLDAAILFSDILTIMDPMGVPVSFPEGGPVLANPVNGPDDVAKLKPYDPALELTFVFDGISEIRKVLPASPIIGFAGSPFTLACYLIQGKGSSNFDKPKQFLHKYPAASETLFNFLVDIVSRYLEEQIKAGADTVQLFDSWGGILSQDDYRHWSARPVQEIFRRLKRYNVPRILFVNNVAPYLDIVADIDCEVIGVDYRCDIARAAAALPHKAVQGNLDPAVLFGSKESIVRQTGSILDSLSTHDNFIFNLGHGIQPGTPVESVYTLVETVHGFQRSTA